MGKTYSVIYTTRENEEMKTVLIYAKTQLEVVNETINVVISEYNENVKRFVSIKMMK